MIRWPISIKFVSAIASIIWIYSVSQWSSLPKDVTTKNFALEAYRQTRFLGIEMRPNGELVEIQLNKMFSAGSNVSDFIEFGKDQLGRKSSLWVDTENGDYFDASCEDRRSKFLIVCNFDYTPSKYELNRSHVIWILFVEYDSFGKIKNILVKVGQR